MSDSTLSVGVILASVREGRNGEAFASWICDQSATRPEMQAELLDLREWPLPAYDRPPGLAGSEKNFPDGSLGERWLGKINSFDAFVIVTPEYNHGYPGALKNALDYVYSPWNYKPVAFVSYGFNSAGARAVEQLRQVAIELKMIPIRDELNIRLGTPIDVSLNRRAGVMVDELLWWARVMNDAKARHQR